MTLKQRLIHATLFVSLIAVSEASLANMNDDYLSANGFKIELGQSQRYLESKFGIPKSESREYVIWTLKNGNTLAVQFDEYGLSDATISGSKPDFLYAHGHKIVLGQDSVRNVQQKHQYGCYYQTWSEGLVGEYVVRSGPEGSWNLTFRSFGTDDENILINKKLNSISLGYDEPLGEHEYCTY